MSRVAARRFPFAALCALAAVMALACSQRGSPRAASAPPPRAGRPSLRLLLVVPGARANGELGFRFGPPRDVDGDGIADIACGARFTDLASTQMGTVGVWSSAGGRLLRSWEGEVPDALFGQAVLLGPDIDGDGRPDLFASAPEGKHDGVYRGAVLAYSTRSGRRLWSVIGEPGEALGWHLAPAADRNGDGIEDLLAGAPGNGPLGMVYLLDGSTGSTLQSYASPGTEDQFGWYVCDAGDLDGDGVSDILVGAPSAAFGGAPRAGAAYAISSAGGRVIHAFRGDAANGQMGEVVVSLADIDGDRVPDVGVSRTFHPSFARDGRVGEVSIYSGRSGAPLRLFRGRDPGELYGRMIAPAGDLDGDGVGDVAIGAPWSGPAGRSRAGRFEVRSGHSGEVLLEAAGDRAEMWLGWHIAAADGLGAGKERGIVVSAIRSEEGGLVGAGALHVYAVTGPRVE